MRVFINICIRHSELVSESLRIDYEILKYIQDDVQCWTSIFMDTLIFVLY